MSHFVVLVIGDDVEGQLEPYCEGLEMEPYETDCHCIGEVALEEAHEKAVKEYMGIEKIREQYHALPINARTDAKWDEMVGKLKD